MCVASMLYHQCQSTLFFYIFFAFNNKFFTHITHLRCFQLNEPLNCTSIITNKVNSLTELFYILISIIYPQTTYSKSSKTLSSKISTPSFDDQNEAYFFSLFISMIFCQFITSFILQMTHLYLAYNH